MLNRTELNYGSISVKLDDKGIIDEVSFIEDPALVIKYNEQDLFKTDNLIKSLEKIENHLIQLDIKFSLK
ncbi:hypothetical protein SAMN05421827_10263 [Pedobacter terrae]|uniref:Uncharacterized protein n=1 Tax=Pedobacter terrae TaxID=405671 RepID=A0A1G7PXQ2_9SPHI|nr:hypothetical protein [Pedobacter terrae]SDF90439.1 hypothetical protein SAMN05421827_10263 [Pedobacter terrae]